MIHNIAIKIVDSLSKYGSAQKKRDVYIYGTECFINETIGNFLLFGIAIPLHQGWPVFIWLISFLSIRIHLGGYHAPHHWLCLVISTFVGISSIFFNWIWNSISGYSILILFFCDAYILFTKAVIHKNHPMTQKKLRRERFTFYLFYRSILQICYIYLTNNLSLSFHRFFCFSCCSLELKMPHFLASKYCSCSHGNHFLSQIGFSPHTKIIHSSSGKSRSSYSNTSSLPSTS